MILKSKNLYENKSLNQIDLFDEIKDQDNFELLNKIEDFQFEQRLSKEFEALGFFISDHPLNQYKEIFPQYNVINFNDFNLDENIKDGVIAATILKNKKKRTRKVFPTQLLNLQIYLVYLNYLFSQISSNKREIF